MEKLVHALINRMPEVRLHTSSRVEKIEKGNRWRIHLKTGELLEADAVCLALSAPQANRLLQTFAAEIAGDLARIPYESVATVNLAYRRSDIQHPLNGFGFVVPASEKKSFVGCTFSSVKYPGRAPEGQVLLRAFVGGALQHEMFDLNDDLLVERVTGELHQILRIKAPPQFTSVRRYPESMPQYQVGHLSLIDSLEKKLKDDCGLYLTGNAYRGIGIPDCIHHAEETAEKMYALCL